MAFTPNQIRKTIAIVRQHEVLYGSGISTSDAALREELEKLVQSLEGLLPEAKRAELAREEEGGWRRLVPASRGSSSSRKDAGKRSLESIVPDRAEDLEKVPAKGGKKAPAAKAVQPKGAAANKVPAKTAGKAVKPASAPASKGKSAASKAPPAPPKSKPTPAKAAAAPAPKGKASAAAKTATNVPAAKNAPPAAASTPVARPKLEAMHLFDAYARNMLPKYGGYILNLNFRSDDMYTLLEIVGYENLQDIYSTGGSLIFKTAGCKLYGLVEQARFAFKNVEPVNRNKGYTIPYRFSELDKLVTKKFQTIYVGKKPLIQPTSFSVLKPTGEDLSVLFYDVARVFENIQDFLIAIFRERNAVPIIDARKATELIVRGLKGFSTWLDQAK
jgi:hypothetical protein